MRDMGIEENFNVVSKTKFSALTSGEKVGVVKSALWIHQNYCNPEFKIPRKKLKNNLEKKKVLTKRNRENPENRESTNQPPKNDELSKFMIDYLPICFEEELEMMAKSFAKEKKKKPN